MHVTKVWTCPEQGLWICCRGPWSTLTVSSASRTFLLFLSHLTRLRCRCVFPCDPGYREQGMNGCREQGMSACILLTPWRIHSYCGGQIQGSWANGHPGLLHFVEMQNVVSSARTPMASAWASAHLLLDLPVRVHACDSTSAHIDQNLVCRRFCFHSQRIQRTRDGDPGTEGAGEAPDLGGVRLPTSGKSLPPLTPPLLCRQLRLCSQGVQESGTGVTRADCGKRGEVQPGAF